MSKTKFLQATQAVKIQIEIDKKFRFVELDFSNQRFRNSSGDEQGDRDQEIFLDFDGINHGEKPVKASCILPGT